MSKDKSKQLAFAICEFLQKAVADKTIDAEHEESLQVAVQCISDSFGFDVESQLDKSKLSMKPANLEQIFDVYWNTKQKKENQNANAAPQQQTTAKEVSNADKKEAEELKQNGNAKLSEKKYDEAIELYTQAINLDPTSAVYYSNRAAAYSLLGKHNAAIEDCNAALKIDSNYSKAYSRLGLAYFELAKYKESVDAYKNALALEPSNTNVQQFLATAEAKLKLSDLSGTTSSTARSGPSMPPGGGMPDLSSLLNNPALMNMAQQFMGGQGADAGVGPGAGAGGLGGMDFGSLMNNPQIKQMAQQVMQNPEMLNGLLGSLGGAGGGMPGSGSQQRRAPGNDDVDD